VTFQDVTLDGYIEEAKEGIQELDQVVGSTGNTFGGPPVPPLPPLHPPLVVDTHATRTETPLNSMTRMMNQGMGRLRAFLTTPRGANVGGIDEKEGDDDRSTSTRRSQRLATKEPKNYAEV